MAECENIAPGLKTGRKDSTDSNEHVNSVDFKSSRLSI